MLEIVFNQITWVTVDGLFNRKYVYLSVLNNSRKNIKDSFNEYLNVLSEQLKYINYEN